MTFELWTLITDERHVWLSYISGCRLGTYDSVLPPKIKLIGWLEQFLCTLKNWVFFAIISMNFFWGKILEKPPYKVKIYAEPYRWWNFDRKILFQKVFWKKFVLQLKIAKFKKTFLPGFLVFKTQVLRTHGVRLRLLRHKKWHLIKNLSRYSTLCVFSILAAVTTKIVTRHPTKNGYFSYKPCWSSPKNRSFYPFKLAGNEETLKKNFKGPK